MPKFTFRSRTVIAVGTAALLALTALFWQSMAAGASPPAGPLLEIDEHTTKSLRADLAGRGELVRALPNYSGVQMVAIERGPGGALRLSAASDPRKGGSAAAE